MSQPLSLPDDPQIKDVAHGLVQTHECLEQARAEIRQNTNALVLIQGQNTQMFSLFTSIQGTTKIVRRFGLWIASVVIAAEVGILIQNQGNHSEAIAAATSAETSAKAAAASSAHVSRQLGSLGATAP